MNQIKFKGKTIYQNIETGFWGLIDIEEQKWLPINMPEELQKEGLLVEITCELLDTEFSIHMWGKAINILGFNIIENLSNHIKD